MAKTIPENLTSFRNRMDGKLSSISGCVSKIVTGVTDLSSCSQTVKSGVSENYKSSTSDNQAIIKLDNTITILNGISSEVENTINSAVSKSETIITNVNSLEELIKVIDEQDKIIREENAKDEETRNFGRLNGAKSTKTTKENEFDQLVEKTNTVYEELIGMDKSTEVDTTTGDSSSTQSGADTLATYTQYLNNLKYGSFTQQSFTSSTGQTMQYWLYVPDYGTEVTGLPVMMYLHGGGGDENSMTRLTYHGLTKCIANKEITPSGIVICHLVTKFFTEETTQTLKELTDTVVKTYNADPNRISISGHSYGAVQSYQMVNTYPNYYAACIPISGSTDVTSSFKDTKVWAFHGGFDNKGSISKLDDVKTRLSQIDSMGGDTQLYVFDRMGHAYVQDKTYEGQFESPDGKVESPLEWAFKQTKA